MDEVEERVETSNSNLSLNLSNTDWVCIRFDISKKSIPHELFYSHSADCPKDIFADIQGFICEDKEQWYASAFTGHGGVHAHAQVDGMVVNYTEDQNISNSGGKRWGWSRYDFQGNDFLGKNFFIDGSWCFYVGLTAAKNHTINIFFNGTGLDYDVAWGNGSFCYQTREFYGVLDVSSIAGQAVGLAKKEISIDNRLVAWMEYYNNLGGGASVLSYDGPDGARRNIETSALPIGTDMFFSPIQMGSPGNWTFSIDASASVGFLPDVLLFGVDT